MNLEQFIVDYIRQHRSTTFGELQEAGSEAGYPMHGKMELGCGDGCGDPYFWSAMSEEFVTSVHNLICSKQVRIVPTTKLDYLMSSPRLIVSKQTMIPCRLEAT